MRKLVAFRASILTLIFSAKEAFYKFQYPIARERLNFHDARIEVMEWGGTEGAFKIHTLAAARRLQGRYLFHENLVTAGMGLAAAAESAQ